jgi:hypothetical protein
MAAEPFIQRQYQRLLRELPRGLFEKYLRDRGNGVSGAICAIGIWMHQGTFREVMRGGDVGVKVAAMVLAAAVLMGVASCMGNMISNNSEASRRVKMPLKDRMMEYINGRGYDDTFYFREDNIYGSMDREIFVKSDKFPADYDYITVGYSREDGKEVFADDYLFFKFREQTRALLNEILADVLGHDFKLFYYLRPGVGSGKVLPADTAFEDYIASRISTIMFEAVLAPGYDIGDRDVLVEKLRDAFISRNVFIYNGALRFCDDPDTYEALDEHTLSHFMGTYNRDAMTADEMKPMLHMRRIGEDSEFIEWR